MFIDENGLIKNQKTADFKKKSNSRQLFTQAKNISSIFLDSSQKTERGFLMTKENMNITMKKLINYLKTKQ